MKTSILFTLLGFLFFAETFGQNQEKYSEFVKEARDLYGTKNFKESAEKYTQAFEQLDGKAYSTDRYDAACSYALANDSENSFYHLFYLAENPKIKYNNYDHILTDSDLESLHKDERWNRLIETVKNNKVEYEKNPDKPLIAILDSIYQNDQKYRRQIDSIDKEYGWESEEMNALWNIISEKDSINLIMIKKILDERGWLGSDVIGNQGNSTLFLVIQHSDIETQEKYLPMMRNAVKQGNARAGDLALLEDRVALRKGKRQIYGSQIERDPATGEYFASPIIEPEKVNERRAEVGLGTIEEYVSHWNITWDVEKHKKHTEIIESEKKE